MTGHIPGSETQLLAGIFCSQPAFMHLVPILSGLKNRTFFAIQAAISYFSHLALPWELVNYGYRMVQLNLE